MLDALLGVLSDEEGDQTQSNQPQEAPASDRFNVPIVSNSPLRRYLSSGSARRRTVKHSNCLFCRFDCEKIILENHLKDSDICLTLYKRKLHCSSIDGVLHKIYDKSCLFCQGQVKSVKFHLETNRDCCNQYFLRYNVETIR